MPRNVSTRRFLVIGLGQFGSGVARRLSHLGHEVLALDMKAEHVQAIAEHVTHALILDATDERALSGLAVDGYSAVVVAIGMDAIEHSIMVTALLRQLGTPYIVGRATSPLHARILRAVGAHEVVNPEERLAEMLADKMAHPGLLESFTLGQGFSAIELEVPATWVGRTLLEVDVRRRHGVNIAALRRVGPRGELAWSAVPAPDAPFREADVLLAIGHDADLEKLLRSAR